MHVKEKKVELIELFYDLIFVFAISKLTSLISHPINGFIPPVYFLQYLITSFVILQAWLYFTNYVNRYCKWEWYDYIIICVNMISVIYMANMISLDLQSMYFTFDIAMLVILSTIAILYSIHIIKDKKNSNAARNSVEILTIVCLIYLVAIFCNFFGLWGHVSLINVVAILAGAFLPFFIRGDFDKSIISFPHLVERFELLTIITFGEAIVGLTHFFNVDSFNLIPILVFLIVLTMFGAYVIQIHRLVNHMRVERSLRLMFSHYFIVISINLVTVAFELIYDGAVNHFWNSILILSSLLLFYISILVNKAYYKEDYSLTGKDTVIIILLFLTGSSLIFIFINEFYAFLIGNLIITFGIFGLLLKKYKDI